MKYPCKGIRTIDVLGVKEEIVVLEYSSEPMNFHIMQDEMYRLAFKFNIHIVKLIDSGFTEDLAYFRGNGYLTNPVEPWRKCVRFFATYEINRFNSPLVAEKLVSQKVVYFGSGSAGGDNVSSWDFKSNAYEIAHKRAKVNGLRQALGLLDYRVEGDIDIVQDGEFKIPNLDIQENLNSKKISEQQAKSIISIYRRLCLNETKECVWDQFSKECNLEALESFLGKYPHQIADDFEFFNMVYDYLFNTLSYEDASKLIIKFGNFSKGVEKP